MQPEAGGAELGHPRGDFALGDEEHIELNMPAMAERISWLFEGLAICLLVALPLGCSVPAADGPSDSFGLDFTLPEGSQARGVVIFVVDGVNAVTFQQLLDAGDLPAMQKYFVERGLYVPRAAASHPSLTMDNLTSIVTGRFPGHHGLVAAKSFDRDRLVFRNYETLQDKNKLDEDYRAPTLYQQFPDDLTFSLFLQPHAGATYFFENRTTAGPAIAFGLYGLVDRVALYRFHQVTDIARRYGRFPAVSTVYQLSVNFAAYEYGASSEQYRQAIRDLDRQFGRVLGDLKRAGLLDRIIVAFVSDHGHCDTPRHGKIAEFVESLGIKLADATPLGEETSFEQRLKYFGQVTAVPYGPGDRYWVLYLRKPVYAGGQCVLGNWLQRPDPEDLCNYPVRNGKANLPQLLAEQPYVDAVAYRVGPGRVRVVRKAGQVEFRDEGGPPERPQEKSSYHLISGTDPLDWAGKVPANALAGEPLTSRQWLQATAQTELPDLGIGLLSYFDGALAADLVIFPGPQWDFDGWRHAGHGGIRAAEMFSPMLIAGPGIPRGRIPVARTVDLMPTLLEALGKPVPAGLDGESLLSNEPVRP